MKGFAVCYKDVQTDELPEFINIDTCFWFAALVKGQDYHTECLDFLNKIQKEKNIMVVCSELVRAELMCAVLCLKVREEIAPKRNVMKYIKNNPDIIKKYHSVIIRVLKAYDEMVEGLNYYTSVPLNSDVVDISITLMGKYRLCSYDAQHAATMEYTDVNHIATIDKDLAHLPKYRADTYVWSPKKY